MSNRFVTEIEISVGFGPVTQITHYPTYTGSLTPADFRGAVFTCAHIQKIAQISSLWNFHQISEGINSLMRFWLVCNDLSAADFDHADFCQT